MEVRDRLIDVITKTARQLDNDDLCLLLVYLFALTDKTSGAGDGA